MTGRRIPSLVKLVAPSGILVGNFHWEVGDRSPNSIISQATVDKFNEAPVASCPPSSGGIQGAQGTAHVGVCASTQML